MSSSTGLGWQSAQSLAIAVEGSFNMLGGGDKTPAEKREEAKQQHRFTKSVDDMGPPTCNDSLKPVSLRRAKSDIVSRASTPVTAEGSSILRSSHSEDIRKPKKLDKYGFIVNMDSHGVVLEDYGEHDERIPTFAETKVTQRRIKKWNSMMSSWELSKKRRRLLSKRLRKGVPDQLRGTVWTMLGDVSRMKETNVGKYDDLVHQAIETRTDRMLPSQALLQTKSFKATQETIERDIHRTYPRHSMFHEDSDDDDDDDILAVLNDSEVSDMIAELEGDLTGTRPKTSLAVAEGGQASLRRVLRAYSCYDREVGYCQGMNFIAGMFLTFTSEEDAFWLLVAVMNNEPCRMRGLFGEGMHETHQVLYIAENLLHQFLPKLAKHLDKENVHITMYATQWLLTLYTSSFKFDLVTRVWDVFLAEGWKVVYRVMLALMQYSMPVLMMSNFEETLAYFRDLPNQVDANKVMDIAFKIPLRKKHVLKYEKEYKARQQQQ